jgi:epidermal growth factor receptor substrate 15
MEVAEIFEPSPVSGCTPGGPGGTTSAYSESHSETRTRSVEHTTSRGWEETYGEEHTETYGTEDSIGGSEATTESTTLTDTTTEGGSEVLTDMFSNTSTRARTNSIDFSQSGTDSYGWSVNNEVYGEVNGSVTAEASGGVPGVFSVGGSATAGFVAGARHSRGTEGSTSSTTGARAGSSTTDTNSATESHSRAVGRHWERSQSYAETNSFTRTDTWNTTKSYSEAASQSVSYSMSLGESDTETFTLSTTDAESLHTSAEIFAGQFGVWYRQTTRLARRGTVVVYDLCGNGSAVGEVTLDDWTWAPDLAIGQTCPPEPNFPAAECRIPPCESR